MVVVEYFDKNSRKGRIARAAITAMMKVVMVNKILLVPIPRTRQHQNKYQEAKELVKYYPSLSAFLIPRRKVYQNEHRNMVLFEALAMVDKVRKEGALGLAAAMG